MIFRNDILRRLIKAGIETACGKPLAEATLSELQDELGRHELNEGKRSEQSNEQM
jgi:hypothetical protein